MTPLLTPRTAALSLTLALSSATAALAADTVSFTAQADVEASNVVLYLNDTLALPDVSGLMDADAVSDLQRSMQSAKFEGKFGTYKTFYGLGDFNAVTVIGTGDQSLTRRKLHDLGGHAAKAPGDDTVAIVLGALNTEVERPGTEIAVGYQLGDYSFRTYKTGKTGQKGVTNPPNDDRNVFILSLDSEGDQAVMDNDYNALVEGVTLTRDFGNEPGLSVYPEEFVQRVRAKAQNVPGLEVRVLELAELTSEGMGAILGVGKGSVHDPRMLILEYRGGDSSDNPIALVGKGITFDTGGISLKPNTGQWLMKSDLSGAAAVAGTVLAAAKRGANVNIVGLMPLAENMPGSRAIRPGDVLTTYNGTTIEVMSTDAEGRLLLADAVAYAEAQYDPDLLVDIATLTGSAARAMGDDYGAVVTRDFDLSLDMMEIGKKSGEDVWPLPLNDSHFEQISSDIADIKSTAGSPGASIGAAVVGTFISEDQPWVHLDIAGVDWRDSSTPTAPKGHAGWGVRFLDQLLRDYETK